MKKRKIERSHRTRNLLILGALGAAVGTAMVSFGVVPGLRRYLRMTRM
ncbi:hypothetical protein [Anaeromyxobacter paludicola]|uniref:Uncharacterized protein n=1 Tax=Anaeromyxobacter paludicola TaxID=2918171 RepID=A0ABN6N4L9_9BACT|nr:hypothetical protein [Anaeromyxobacter paludicola]BDG07951.1 hypothetical protein AMPC_10640 [Anaeromyxobacter paludicola]